MTGSNKFKKEQNVGGNGQIQHLCALTCMHDILTPQAKTNWATPTL